MVRQTAKASQLMTQPTPRMRRARVFTIGLAVLAMLAATGCSRRQADVSASTPATSSTSSASSTSTTATTSTEAPGPTGPAAPAAVVSVDPPLGSGEIAPLAPLTVSVENGTLTGVAMTGPGGARVAGALSGDGKSWQTTERLGYDTIYYVAATAANGAGAAAVETGSIRTVAPRTLTMASLLPSESMGSVGVGMPIVVKFDEDIEDKATVERRLTVTTTPAVVGVWSWFGDREVHYRPQEYWTPGTQVVVDVEIYGINVGDIIYGQEDRHLEFVIHDALVAQVDNSDLTLRVYRNGVLEREMPTSMGKEGHLTPSGTYVVMQQDRRYTMDSSTYGTPIDDPDGYRTEVEYASRISYSGIFVHAAPWSVADQGLRNVSHGCLNVNTANAGYFYENFGWGDIVQVTGTGVALRATDGLGDWNISWAEWILGSALS